MPRITQTHHHEWQKFMFFHCSCHATDKVIVMKFSVLFFSIFGTVNASRIGDGTKELIRQDKDDAKLDSKWTFQREGVHIDNSQDVAIESDPGWNPHSKVLTESDHFDSVTSTDAERDYNANFENLGEVDETDGESARYCKSWGYAHECWRCCEGSRCVKRYWYRFCLPQPTSHPTSIPPTPSPMFWATMTHHHSHEVGGRRPRPSSMIVVAPVFNANE